MAENDKRRKRKAKQKNNKQADKLGLHNYYGVIDPVPMQAVNRIIYEKIAART